VSKANMLSRGVRNGRYFDSSWMANIRRVEGYHVSFSAYIHEGEM